MKGQVVEALLLARQSRLVHSPRVTCAHTHRRQMLDLVTRVQRAALICSFVVVEVAKLSSKLFLFQPSSPPEPLSERTDGACGNIHHEIC